MNLLTLIRRRLGLKIFLSYVAVILVGVVVLATSAELVVPSAFEQHLATMRRGIGHMMGGFTAELEDDLYLSFRSAVSEALVVAAVFAAGMAVIASLLISRKVVAPIQEMMRASRRIAEGHYDERVRVEGNLARAEQDELGQLALSFNQMAERLQKTETMRSKLIADVTHELRTPLAAIKGSLEGLIDGVLPADAETLQDIYRETGRLQRLVDDLQELSRVEAGAYEVHRKPISSQQAVGRVVEHLARQYEEKGVSLSTSIQPGLPPVLADEDRLIQVLTNLVGNALQYTQPGGGVVVRVEERGSAALFSVADTGIGIPAEHLPHVFTRFYRVDPSRTRASGGSGIGLTIARHLVESHGGNIWVESPGAGQGSTFFFTLPFASP